MISEVANGYLVATASVDDSPAGDVPYLQPDLQVRVFEESAQSSYETEQGRQE